MLQEKGKKKQEKKNFGSATSEVGMTRSLKKKSPCKIGIQKL